MTEQAAWSPPSGADPETQLTVFLVDAGLVVDQAGGVHGPWLSGSDVTVDGLLGVDGTAPVLSGLVQLAEWSCAGVVRTAETAAVCLLLTAGLSSRALVDAFGEGVSAAWAVLEATVATSGVRPRTAAEIRWSADAIRAVGAVGRSRPARSPEAVDRLVPVSEADRTWAVARGVLAAGGRPAHAGRWARVHQAAGPLLPAGDVIAMWRAARPRSMSEAAWSTSAVLWAEAGFSPAEAGRAAALPVGHPDRPEAGVLAAMTALRGPAGASGR